MGTNGFVQVKGQCWDNFMVGKPQLSSGAADLTPNQIAERAASDAARLTIVEDKNGDIREYGMLRLAKAVGCKPREEDSMSSEELRYWAAGWKAGFYELGESCYETVKSLRSIWMAGEADGTRASMKMEKIRRRSPEIKPTFQIPKFESTPDRTAKIVTKPEEMKIIWSAHLNNGGPFTYQKIELIKAFGLRWANGMTAYRIIKKYDMMRKMEKEAKKAAKAAKNADGGNADAINQFNPSPCSQSAAC